MYRIKLVALTGVLLTVVIVLNSSPGFSASATSDSLIDEISGYKSWTKVTREPYRVELQPGPNTFVVDGSVYTIDFGAFG